MTFRSPAKIQAAPSENKMSHIKARFQVRLLSFVARREKKFFVGSRTKIPL
jgi:hypothetical protein